MCRRPVGALLITTSRAALFKWLTPFRRPPEERSHPRISGASWGLFGGLRGSLLGLLESLGPLARAALYPLSYILSPPSYITYHISRRSSVLCPLVCRAVLAGVRRAPPATLRGGGCGTLLSVPAPNPKPQAQPYARLPFGIRVGPSWGLGSGVGPWPLGLGPSWGVGLGLATLVPRSSELVAHSRFGSKMHQQMLAAAAASTGCRPGDLPWHSGGDLPWHSAPRNSTDSNA